MFRHQQLSIPVSSCLLACLAIGCLTVGCTSKPENENANAAQPDASPSNESDLLRVSKSDENLPPANLAPGSSDLGSASADKDAGSSDVEELPQTPPSTAAPTLDSMFSLNQETPKKDLASDLNRRQLRKDFTPEELIEWLEFCDIDMRNIGSGKTQLKDPVDISRMLEAIAKKKLEASEQLLNHADANEQQKTAGLRGQLQSLSHLASMGDLKSAKALKKLATTNLNSPIPSVAGDSRIVLIGFALDSLRGGSDKAANEVVELVKSMQPTANADIPAVLMLAEARQTLSDYGMIDQAAEIRGMLLELYGNSSDPTVAKIAADAAGTAKFDRARRLLDAILDNDQVAVERWTDVVEELLNDSPDIITVQFLLESSLHLEVFNRPAFVKTTYDLLTENFPPNNSTIANEIEAAKQAMLARQKIIGADFDFTQYPVIVDQDLTSSDYQGKVVLMPFWATQFPVSLQIIPRLMQVQQKAPEQIAIIGMNLDSENSPVREFVAVNKITFPSMRSVSSTTGEVANPVAAEFGLVSMPFVAVIDQKGKVVALDFSGLQLDEIVEDLLAK